MPAVLYAVVIALCRIGAARVFLDLSFGVDDVTRCLQMVRPKAFFGSAKAQWLRLWMPEMKCIERSFCSARVPGATHISLRSGGVEPAPIVPTDEQTPALITFTSGSTGQPKAALRTDGFLLTQHHALRTALQHCPGTYDLTTLPIFVLANLGSGVTSILPDADMRRPGFVAPRPVIRQLQRLPTTRMAASPAFVSRLTAEYRRSWARIESMKKVFLHDVVGERPSRRPALGWHRPANYPQPLRSTDRHTR